MWLASKDHGRPPGVIILHVVGKVLILRAGGRKRISAEEFLVSCPPFLVHLSWAICVSSFLM